MLNQTDVAEELRPKEAVRFGLWVSATRCLLVYVVAPTVGGFGGLVNRIGLILQILGTVVALSGAMHLWRLHHRSRIGYSLVAGLVAASTVIAVASAIATSIATDG